MLRKQSNLMQRNILKRSPQLRLLQLLFSAICLVGALYQISEIAAIYFAYATSSIVELKIPTEYKIDSLTFCTRYIDVFDFDRFNQDHPHRRWKRSNLNEFWVRSYQDELTISDIFKYTPKEDIFIDHVEFRRKRTFKVFECNGANCYQYFSVKRFIYLEYICYTVDANYRNETLSYQALTITPSAPGQILDIVVSRELERSFLIKIVSHAPNSIPYVSLQNAPVKQRTFDDETKQANYNWFVSSSVKLRINRLPPPYDTMCENYLPRGYERRYDAIQDCVKGHVLNVLGKMPFSVVINDSADLNIISYFDLINSTVTEKLFQFHAQCAEVYHRDDCASEIPFTLTDADAGDRIGLKLITAASPFTTINVVTQTTFVQLVSIAMSTASTWTGFAVISLNPVFWYPQFRGMMIQLFGFMFNRRGGGSYDQRDSPSNSPDAEKVRWRDQLLYQRRVYDQIKSVESRVRLMEMRSTKYFQTKSNRLINESDENG